MIIPYSIVTNLAALRISRRLDRSGDMLVEVGSVVKPDDIIARATQPGDFCMVDIARALHVPEKRANAYSRVQRQDVVEKGMILAAKGRRACESPLSGVVTSRGLGQLLIEASPQPVELKALVPGTVVETIPSVGAVIQTVGGMVQAVWGNGAEAFGALKVAVHAPWVSLRQPQLKAGAQGCILVGGLSLDEKAIDRALELQVRGVIVGSILPHMMKIVQALPFPVLVTEGLGQIPMSRAVFELLRSFDGQDAAVCAGMGGRGDARRPYVLIPVLNQTGLELDVNAPLTTGSRVRILRGAFAGVSGEVVHRPVNSGHLETGARLSGVYVDIGNRQVIFTPCANIERLI